MKRLEPERRGRSAVKAAAIVILDDLLDGRGRAVVQEEVAPFEVAQARRLEGVVRVAILHDEAASLVVGRHADIGEATVGEVPSVVALDAVRFAAENEKPVLLASGEGA